MTSQEIANALLDIEAFKFSLYPPFTWTSGIKAPVYCDNRLLFSYPEHREKVIQGFEEVIKKNNLEFDVIGGTATAAIPWASFLALKLNKPLVYIRPKPKEFAAKKQVEGTMKPDSRILIVEDLISTGGSSLRSGEACVKEYNAKFVAVIAIMTYEMQTSIQEFATKNIPLFTLSNLSTLLQVGLEREYIKPQEKEHIIRWSQNPEHWTI